MTKIKGLGWWCVAAAALLIAGCGDTAVDGNPGGDTGHHSDIIGGDTSPVDPGGECWTQAQCTDGLACVGDGATGFICGAINPGMQPTGGVCVINADCELNACQAGYCGEPKPDDNPNVIIGTGGTCSWIDSPEDCMDWKCYYESGKTICRHNDQGVPNGNVDWTCVDAGGNTLCTYSGTPTSNSDGNVTTTDPSWSCDYSTATDTTSCMKQADMPDQGDPAGWSCEFPDSGGGIIKVCEMAGGGPAVSGCDVGNIEGYACTPSLDVVSGATVTITYTDCNGNPATTVVESDSLGYFVLANIPVGAWSISISKGPYNVTQSVSVSANQTTSFTEGDPRTCFDPDATKIAVVGGAYDAIGDVLTELGFEYDYYNGVTNWQGWNFLLDPAALDAYDIVYINCGVHPEANFGSYMAELQTIGGNLRNFVDAGHYIYASDWAYYFIEAAYPDRVDFRGEDFDPFSVLVGAIGLHAVAVTDVEMQAYTGLTTTTIDLNLPQWAVPQGVGAGVKTYLRGDAKLLDGSVMTNVPFLVDFQSGAGSAAYTSYHIHENESVSSIFAFIALNFK